MRIAVVVGTRPEAIKLAPVVALLGTEAFVVHTGQHYSAGMSGHLTPDLLLDTSHDHDITRGHQLGRPRLIQPAHPAPAVIIPAGARNARLCGPPRMTMRSLRVQLVDARDKPFVTLAVRARGRTGGQKPKLGPSQVRLARQMYDELGADGKRRYTVQQIAKEFGVTRPTIYRYLQACDEVTSR